MRFVLLTFLLFSGFFSFSQELFQNISFDEALAKSQLEGKLIFLQFYSAECTKCDELANKSFENDELAEQLTKTFICIRITPDHKDRELVGALYNISKGAGSLFIDQNKTLIHSYRMTTTKAAEYSKQINIALSKAGESLKVNELDTEYKKGNRTIGFLELYLQKRRTLSLTTDELLDEYVSLLPDDSVRSLRTIRFIAQMTPLLESKADQVLRKDQRTFSRALYSMTPQQRAAIYTVIIGKSRRKAIQEKNEAYALKVAAFAQSTYMSNYQAGSKAYESTMLEFYRQTNDSSKYLMKAIGYYYRFYMSVSVDSIKRKDSLTRARLFANAKVKDSLTDANKKPTTITFVPLTQYFSRNLNNGAWAFYKMTNNPYLLSLATEWVKKGLEFYEGPEALDTYSRLLYKQGQKNIAIEMEQKSIDLRKKRGFPTMEFETTLEKMKKNNSIID